MKFSRHENNRIDIQCERDIGLHIFVLEKDIFRIAFTRKMNLGFLQLGLLVLMQMM